MNNGIYHASNGDEECITPDKIKEVSTVVDKRNLTMPQIFIAAEEHRRGSHDVTVRPRPKKRSLQEAADTLDEMLHGKVTLNRFFAKIGLPPRSETGANILLRPTESGCVAASDGKAVNIRPLFPSDMLFQLVEMRRKRILNGIG
jgi:hypothetical protein